MSYCEKCGNQLSEGAVFCAKCGTPVKSSGANTEPQSVNPQQSTTQVFVQPVVQPVYTQPVYQQPISTLPETSPVLKLSEKIKIEAMVWIIIAVIQVVIGIYEINLGNQLNDFWLTRGEGNFYIFYGVVLLIVAVINIIISIMKFSRAAEITFSPVGICDEFLPIGGRIGNLIYNILFGGIIGIVGSIFGFVTRSYVVNNQAAFAAIEFEYKQHKHDDVIKKSKERSSEKIFSDTSKY